MLPRPLASFIGRRADSDELRASIERHALTTLIGAPGVGKTRLALETARSLGDEFGERRWFADLAPVNEPELVVSTVQAAVEAPTRHGDTITDIARFIGSKRSLLLLDNCEHQLRAASELCLALLSRCEHLCIVATSRSELRVEGEQVLALHPLETVHDRYRQSEAVQLFYDRADSQGAGLRRDAAEIETVSQICAQVDGLPLAIELAASRSRILELPELLERMSDPLEVLSSEPRQSVTGRRTLSDSIASSHLACGDSERRGFEALSVFGGSFDLPPAHSVLQAVGIRDVLGVIDSLVSSSLLHAYSDGDGRIRYRMLTVVRAYSRKQLSRRAGYEELAREAHAKWYARIGTELELSWVGPDQPQALRGAALELSNIREAAAYAIERERQEHLVGLVLLPAAELWWATGRLQEGLYWLRRTLELRGLRAEIRFRALMLTATFCYGLRLLEEGDRCISELDSIMEGVEDPYSRGAFAYARGFGEIQRGDPERAISTLTECMRVGDSDPELIRMSLRSRQLLVYAENLRRDDAAAAKLCEQILRLSEQAEETYFAAFAHQMLALYAWRRDEGRSARSHAKAALRSCRDFPNRPENIDLLIVCALLEERWGDPRRAEILLAAAGKADSVGLRPATAAAQDVREEAEVIAARSASTSHSTGSSFTAYEAIVFALGRSGSTASSDSPSLTRRETEIVHLIREGMANKQIAKTLGVSTKTVEGHIARLMAKLGVASRVQVAMWSPPSEGARASEAFGRD